MKAMLTPAAVLAVWTMVMMGWMLVVSGRAYRQAGLAVSTSQPGTRGQDLAGKLPNAALWPGHNYTHLVEQPTVFYAVVVILALTGSTATDIGLAWGYVVLRIIHSIWQATINRLPVRFALFAASSAALVVLSVRAILATS